MPNKRRDFTAVARRGVAKITKTESGIAIKVMASRGRPKKTSEQQLERQREVVAYYHAHGLEATLAHFPEINSARTVLEYERRVDKAPQR